MEELLSDIAVAMVTGVLRQKLSQKKYGGITRASAAVLIQ